MAEKLKKSRFRGIIFDMDGTLADTLEDIADSLNRVLLENGFPGHDYEIIKTLVGKGVESLVTNAIPEGAREKAIINRCLESMAIDYNSNCLTKTKLYPGIAEMFDKLKQFNIKASVLSNKTEELTRKIADALITNYNLNAVFGARPDLPKKPDPAGALMICNEFRISPDEMLFVGDSGIDMTTAGRAGMFAAGATWGFRTREELLENGAKILLDHPLDLISLL